MIRICTNGDCSQPVLNSPTAAYQKKCLITGVALAAIALIAAGALLLVLHVNTFAAYALLGGGGAFFVADLTAVGITSVKSRIRSSSSESLLTEEVIVHEDPIPSRAQTFEGKLNEWVRIHKKNHENILEAERRITHCFQTNSACLDLSNLNLPSLPDIFEFLELKTLNLIYNQLPSLPESFGNLTQLIHLNLDSNQLSYLPESFGNLTQLTELYLDRNQLSSLPESFGKLTQLTVLSLEFNQLSSLPESFGNLTQLLWLYLISNQLPSLPESFENLTQLIHLNLDSNQLSYLPESVFELPPSCTVYVENNFFSTPTVRRIQSFTNTPEYQGPRIIFSIGDRSQMELRSLDELLDDLCKAADKERLVFDKLKENAQLPLWLNRLVDVGDYKQSKTRKNLAVMIYDALSRAENDDAFYSTFVACLLDADTTCGDRMALSILYLGLNLQIQAAEDEGDLERMADLLWRGTYAISELEKMAESKIASLKGVDPVEVYLGYPVALKTDLNLPIDIDSMLYFSCSGITDEDLEEARSDLEGKLSDEEKRFGFLVERSTWTKMLEKHPRTKEKYKELNAQRFESAEDPALAEQAAGDFREGLLELTREVLSEMRAKPGNASC